jgi:hypothetical protein
MTCQNLLKINDKIVCLVWFYTPTQFGSYGAERGRIILANLGYYKIKATPRVKNPHLLELRGA